MADDTNTNPQQPLNPDLMGYPSVEALVAAKRASDAEAKRLYDESQKTKDLLAQVITNGFPNGRQSVPDRRADNPADRLSEFGVPVDALDGYFEQKLNRALRPLMDGVQARGQIVSQHPDYVQFEADVASFIANDPDLSTRYPKMFEADPAGAMEYAFLKFGESRRRAVPANGGNNGAVGNVADAAIPSSRAGEGRRVPDRSQAIQEAYERFQKTGSSRDAEAYAKLRLHNVIKDEFLNQ